MTKKIFDTTKKAKRNVVDVTKKKTEEVKPTTQDKIDDELDKKLDEQQAKFFDEDEKAENIPTIVLGETKLGEGKLAEKKKVPKYQGGAVEYNEKNTNKDIDFLEKLFKGSDVSNEQMLTISVDYIQKGLATENDIESACNEYIDDNDYDYDDLDDDDMEEILDDYMTNYREEEDDGDDDKDEDEDEDVETYNRSPSINFGGMFAGLIGLLVVLGVGFIVMTQISAVMNEDNFFEGNDIDANEDTTQIIDTMTGAFIPIAIIIFIVFVGSSVIRVFSV